MYQGKRVLALIPARGGSKGIPHKNIRLLKGHPLIAYSIAASKNSAYIDRVVVTTDDEEIARVACQYGAEVPFLRPAELATDYSKSIEALVHAVETLAVSGDVYDSVVWLQPTSPLRRSAEIDAAIEVFYSHGCLGVASVCEVSENPVLTRRIDASGVLHPLLPVSSTLRRQDMPKFYHYFASMCFKTGGSNNFGGYSNEEVDALVEKLESQFEQDERDATAQEIAQKVLDDNAYIFFANAHTSYIATNEVSGIAVAPSEYYFITKDTAIA